MHAMSSSDVSPTFIAEPQHAARCITCKLPLNKGSVSGLCRQCHVSLRAFPAPSDITADLKARQARRRKLKPQLADLLRQRAANRAEIAKKILTFVGFDLPE